MFKIFPATINSENQKVPLVKGWKDVATTDQNQIAQWKQQWNGQLKFFGIPTGQTNGIVVLDIDVKPNKKTGEPRNGWASLQKLGYQLPSDTLRQQTPSGGTHLIFRAKPGVHYGNSVNEELGVDVRGDGGWIGFYGFTNPNTLLAEAPDWITSLSPSNKTYDHAGPTINVSPVIAQGIVAASLEAIENAPPGSSNDTLNTESFRLGQLVASGSITREFAEAALFAAAKKRGKPDYESKATIKSGLDGGIGKPLTSPFEEPIVKITMEPPPLPPGRWTPPAFTKAELMNFSKIRKPQLFKDWSTEDIHLMTADGGTGKTTLTLQEAICLALGERFLGFECEQRGNTLFITGEDTREKLAAMLGFQLKQMGLLDDPEKLAIITQSIRIQKDADLCLITKDKQNFLQPNPEALKKVLEAIEDLKPKMIVFDPIASFWGSESALNDMAKAVSKFTGTLVERSGACVVLINHMGKQSSANRDMSQFAGRGGSGLPSHARVSRVLRPVHEDEFTELTGETLPEGKGAMMCVVNKFTDGSPLYNKPFLIMRDGFLFSRRNLTEQKLRDAEKQMSDEERIFTFIKEQRQMNRYPTKNIVIGHFMGMGTNAIGVERCKRALEGLCYHGNMGEMLKAVENPDPSVRDRVYVLTDSEGKEI